jgi:hypothetical protein
VQRGRNKLATVLLLLLLLLLQRCCAQRVGHQKNVRLVVMTVDTISPELYYPNKRCKALPEGSTILTRPCMHYFICPNSYPPRF